LAGGAGLSRQRKTSGGLSNRLRIIGGRWRGRKLDFPAVEGLRPTPDRVRETLFNWLQNDIPSARCLDLFAGSGALGLEALSRGAARVVLVDASRAASQQLEAHLRTLQCQDAAVVNLSAQSFLERGPGGARYDIVFLDPPFHQGLIAVCARLLEQKGWLAPGARIYMECERDLALTGLPAHWEIHREKTAGQVTYRLVTRQPPNKKT
jgi:16S rRNA (guanine966-N2)-methyltransferase